MYTIATRQSPLALWQAENVKELLRLNGFDGQLLKVVTTGDKLQQFAGRPKEIQRILNDSGNPTGKGTFIKEIQEALCENKAQIAVHSMKDLAHQQVNGLVVAGLLPRANPWDVFVASEPLRAWIKQNFGADHKKPEMFLKAVKAYYAAKDAKPIGTISLRRSAALKRIFGSDVPLKELRGNVQTRLEKIETGAFYSAAVLAQAGLERLGIFNEQNMVPLSLHEMVPAPGQGIVAIECLESCANLVKFFASQTPTSTLVAAIVERAVLEILEGDCHTPLGVFFDGMLVHVTLESGGKSLSASIPCDAKAVERFAGFSESYSQTLEKYRNSTGYKVLDQALREKGMI
jgi:hydroxymethylbilane synthase